MYILSISANIIILISAIIKEKKFSQVKVNRGIAGQLNFVYIKIIRKKISSVIYILFFFKHKMANSSNNTNGQF